MASLIPSASASGTGSMTLSGPGTNSNQVITIPDTTGTMMVSGAMPAFRAYANATQSFTTNTFAKIQINTKTFDTNTNYDASTNYRFTPTIAGYYQVNGMARINTASGTLNQVAIYKNGSIYSTGNLLNVVLSSNTNQYVVADMVYLNGSTDYIELWGYSDGTTPSFNYNSAGNPAATFSAYLARSA